MYESRIAADPLTVAMVAGFPTAIDALAASNLAGHGFLRAAWYGAKQQEQGRTLVIRRGTDGDVIAVIPTLAFGPSIAGARKLAGCYWPFRAPLLAPDCNAIMLANALAEPATRSLGAVWRVGPARCDDPAIAMLIEAAQLAGWRVLSRPAGTSWIIDLDAMRASPPPRGSTPRKLRAGWRKLEALGTPRWRTVRGSQWDAEALVAMGRIEADSWIAGDTDGSGAKFLTADQRAEWEHALSDPVIAESLCAIILFLDDRPVAFSFDLDDGPVRYAIAGTHVEDLKHCYIGKNLNYRAMGAVPGYDLADLLFVRSRLAAPLLERVWGRALPATDEGLSHG